MNESLLIWVINGLLVIVSGIGGWFMRQLWDAVKTLQSDLKDLEVKIAKDYVQYDRLKDALSPIMDALSEIKETLKTKADK